jgi:hypothetical protein
MQVQEARQTVDAVAADDHSPKNHAELTQKMSALPRRFGRPAALVYTGISACVAVFQLALALGAPWGSYAMGGAFPAVPRIYAGPSLGLRCSPSWPE